MMKTLILSVALALFWVLKGHASYCREYTQTFSIAGETHQGYGTACLQPDGSWAIQEPSQEQSRELTWVVRQERVYLMPPPAPWVHRPLLIPAPLPPVPALRPLPPHPLP